MQWKSGRFSFGARLVVRRRLGIPTEDFEEFREPLAVDEYIALQSLSTNDEELWH